MVIITSSGDAPDREGDYVDADQDDGIGDLHVGQDVLRHWIAHPGQGAIRHVRVGRLTSSEEFESRSGGGGDCRIEVVACKTPP